MAASLRFITPHDPLYAAELELRFRVLREPLGLARVDVQFPFEPASLHLVAVEGARVLGCVLFHAQAADGGRLFQMAVASDAQGTGLGRRLVETLEGELLRRDLVEVHLHARGAVVGFYQRLGYETFGEPFVEVGMEHRHMRRTLTPR